LFVINTTTGFFNFIPNASQIGVYSIKFNVTDSAGAYNETIVNLTVVEFNDLPILDLIPNFTVDENDYFYYDVNVTDEEDGNDSSGNFTYNWNHTLGWFELDAVTGEINFTANSTMNGNHTINLTVTDLGGKLDWQLFDIIIREKNFMPNITMIMPYGTPLSNATVFNEFANRTDFPENITSITLVENTTVLFNHTSTDPNGDILDSLWYKGGNLVHSGTNSNTAYTHIMGFSEAGQHNITLVIDDGRGMNDTFVWNVTVNNSNRLPLFGLRGHSIYGDILPGRFSVGISVNNTVNITAGGIILAGGEIRGEYLSESIDIGPIVSGFYNPIGFTNISWTADVPEGTNVSVQTRTSDNELEWNEWSIVIINRSYTNSSGEMIVSENTTYIQYKFILETNDSGVTPNVTRVRFGHILPDITLNQGTSNPNWIDLDYHFYDLDEDDTLSFTISEHPNLNLSLNNVTHIVSLATSDYWTGRETIYFTANDSYGHTKSNNLTVIVEPVTTEEAVEYLYITRTRKIVRTRTRTITEPRYLELLAPEHITAFDENTVMAPIILKNNGESILSGLDLTIYSTSDDVELWLSGDHFDSLSPGQVEETQLFIRWEGFINEFDVIVNATSKDPEYSDRAIISVTGLTRVESNKSIEESHIEFVRDLLNNNPECLELTELLIESQRAFDAGNYKKSRNTINFVIEGCRYLVTTKKDVEKPTPIEQREGDLFKLISGILLLLLFIAMVIIFALTTKERKL